MLVALGITAAPLATSRPDSLGLDCHLCSSGATYWLDPRQGPFDSTDSLYDVRRPRLRALIAPVVGAFAANAGCARGIDYS